MGPVEAGQRVVLVYFMKLVFGVTFLVLLGIEPGIAAADLHSTARFNIPPQALNSALLRYSEQSGVEVTSASKLLEGKSSPGVVGMLPARDALNKLLSDTQLHYDIIDSSTVAIRGAGSGQGSDALTSSAAGVSGKGAPHDSANPGSNVGKKELSDPLQLAQAGQEPPASGPAVEKQDEPASHSKPAQLEEVVVTGTLLHKADPLSPLITITHEDIVAQGYSRLDDLIDQLPQNFMAGASAQTNPTNQRGDGAAHNYSRGSGINLRGLGPNATLVLLNGQRLAMSNFGDSVDISMLPISIIERVEILTDGASALYGADAVAGVVNIITRNDFAGVEVGLRDTNLSTGKAPNPGGHVLSGFNWTGGNFVVNYDFEKDNPLYTRARSYTNGSGDPTTLLPKQTTASIFAALRQDLGAGFALGSTFVLGRRDYAVNQTSGVPGRPGGLDTGGGSKQYSGNLKLDYQRDDWHASLAGHYAKEDGLTHFNVLPPAAPEVSVRTLTNHDYGVEALVDRPLFELSGGVTRVALGAAAREEGIDAIGTEVLPPSPASEQRGSRTSRSVFGELQFPLVGARNGIPLVEQLVFDISGRYDHYSDFGSAFNPKFALKWQLPGGVSLHGVYGRSFRVPTLYENIGTPSDSFIYDLRDPRSASGRARVLEFANGNPRLTPEHSRSISAGITFQPTSGPDLRVDLSYFDILFTDKIEALERLGFYTNVLTSEAQLGSLVERDPSLAEVNALLAASTAGVFDLTGPGFSHGTTTPDQIRAILQVGLLNAAIVHPRGLDFAPRYRWGIGNAGRLTLDASASYYLSYTDQIATGAAPYTAVNVAYLPTRFHGKIGLAWDRGGWAAYSRVNFVNAYTNPQSGDPQCPVSCPVASLTTVDAGVSFLFGDRDGYGVLSGTRLGLNVVNLFDRAPPFVYDGRFNYDSTNASALQRAVSVSITKRF